MPAASRAPSGPTSRASRGEAPVPVRCSRARRPPRAAAPTPISDARHRDRAADELGDLLEARSLTVHETHRVVTELVAAAQSERDGKAREAQLHALTYAVEPPFEIVEALTSLMPVLDAEQLGYCLWILGSTGDPAAAEVIGRFSEHPNEGVRASAAEALHELSRSS
jgi:hypothetical protein